MKPFLALALLCSADLSSQQVTTYRPFGDLKTQAAEQHRQHHCIGEQRTDNEPWPGSYPRRRAGGQQFLQERRARPLSLPLDLPQRIKDV